uniref:Phosphatidic acid phosphatase type 2/haloperoxidase domain-containing protein n=1 Tax=Timema bartmani TaxID=61472 RepID=A0A7R9EZD8_9NEOP|nr:unnamed protein product [Timema bartmani]
MRGGQNGAHERETERARLKDRTGSIFQARSLDPAYLQLNMTWGGSKLLKHTLQFGLILLAWWTALTRVTDYMHHWSDVLAGVVYRHHSFYHHGEQLDYIVSHVYRHHSSTITVLFVSDITRKRSSADGPELMVFMNKPNSVYVPPSRQEQGVP